MGHHRLIARLCGFLLAIAAGAASPQDYPARPIRFIVPYAVGGTIDAISRIITQRLSERLRQPVVVDNRPGGDSLVGTDAIAKAVPDGYTIGFTSSGAVSLLPHTRRNVTYNLARDFTHIAQFADGQFALTVNPGVAASTVAELVALARSRPGHLSYASASEAGHVTGEMFKLATGIDLLHVPYKGGAPATTDLLSGQISMMFSAFGNVIPLAKANKLRILAVTGTRRASALPDVPTLAESGIPDCVYAAAYGVSGPRGLPREIVKKLEAEIIAIIGLPDIPAQLLAQGAEPRAATGQQYVEGLRRDSERFAKVIQRVAFVVR